MQTSVYFLILHIYMHTHASKYVLLLLYEWIQGKC
jgi:hypothetical protein